MGSIECRFLGGAEVLVGGLTVPVDTRKAIALMAYVTIEGSVSRDTLAALLWPESDESRARSTLRRTLSSVRSAIGEGAVVADRSLVRLRGVSTDVEGFRAEVVATMAHGHDAGDVCSRCLPHLETAADRYRGDFLAGFSLRDAPDFDDWSRTIAQGLRLECASVLDRLATGRASVGDFRGAVAAGRRWIHLDPLHEPAYRNLMLLSAWAGDTAAAVEAYRACVQVLTRELGVPPLEETTELYEAILDDDLPPPPTGRRRVAVKPTPRPAASPSLVGRIRELAALEEQLELAASGGRIVVVSGRPWMGKTRLIEEFIRRREQGAIVLFGRGYRAEQALPYGIVVQLLRSALSAGRLMANDQPEWVLNELSRILPELGSRPPSGDVLGEARLHDAISTAILSLADTHRLVVAIDDAQWADAASMSVLSYLSHRFGDVPVVVIIATRTDAFAPSGEGAVVDAFRGGSEEVRLDPIEPDELVAVGEDPEVASAAIEQTGGVPLLVAEYLTGEQGVGGSAGMQRYIDTRLDSLDGLTTQLVAAAAILDGTCEMGLLEAVSGRSGDEVVDAVDRLIAARILRVVPGSGGLGFTLDAMARTVTDRLSPVRWRALHARAAEALAALPSARRDARISAAAARHLEQAGDESAAARWYVTAGELAAAVYAHEESESGYRAALAMGYEPAAPIHFALGEVLLLGSRFPAALDAFQAAAAVGDAPTRARSEHRIGEVHRRIGRWDLAEAHFRLAAEGHPEPAALHADWALLDHRRGDVARAEMHARRAVDLARAEGDPVLEARARDILGIVTEDVAELHRALELAGDNPTVRMAALNSLAHAVAVEGDVERALALVDEGIELSRRVGDRQRRAALLNHRSDLCHRSGREDESRAALTESVRLFADIQPDAWEPEVWLLSRW